VKCVLDASVALSWLLEDAGGRQDYAAAVFDAKTEAAGVVQEQRSQTFLAALAAARIVCDANTHEQALTAGLQLARRFRLSAYDASYLELALRLTLPLATLDGALLKAALQAGVRRFEAS